MYVLIITILLMNSYDGGAFAAVHEVGPFNEDTKCDLAKNAYLAANWTNQRSSLVTAVCVRKN